jgi:hypothetical protein
VGSPITGTFDEVKGHNASLVRKMLEMAVFVSPFETGPDIETISDATNQLVVPAGYTSGGIMSKDQGATITPSLDVSETGGYGYGQPIRRDTVSRTSQLAFTMTESKRIAFEVYYGIDLSAVEAAAAGSNELMFEHPDRPDTKYWRVLCLGRDGQGANAIYHAEYFPRMTLADVSEQTFSETDALSWGVTLGADTDSTAGTPQRTFWGGPGLTDSVFEAMGFTRASA